jgi:ABC-2 type transport system ATP-binding protein
MNLSKVIELNNVTKRYGSNTALYDINLSIETGKIIGLLGPNGSGKTTLMKTLMRIIREQEGTVKICGNLASYETRKFISFMPDREYLYDSMTVSDAVNYYRDMFEDFDIKKAYELCGLLNLKMNNKINTLSKGNKEKVVLMLTLSRNVPIYLLDEPLGSLDPLIKHEMLTVIKKEINKDRVIIISTHLIKDTEEILDEAIFLKEGTIVEQFDIKKSQKELEAHYLEVFSNV